MYNPVNAILNSGAAKGKLQSTNRSCKISPNKRMQTDQAASVASGLAANAKRQWASAFAQAV